MTSRVLLLALLGLAGGACTSARERAASVPDGVELLTAHVEILGPG